MLNRNRDQTLTVLMRHWVNPSIRRGDHNYVRTLVARNSPVFTPPSTVSPPTSPTTSPANTATPVTDNPPTVTNTGPLHFGEPPWTYVPLPHLLKSHICIGKCTDPTVIFGAGLDGRKATEFSFLPHDRTQFNHGSALNPDIIFQFVSALPCSEFLATCVVL